MFKLEFEKINYKKLGKFTSFLMKQDSAVVLVSGVIFMAILQMPFHLLDKATIQKHLWFFIIFSVIGGNSLIFLHIKGLKSKRDKAEMTIENNFITISLPHRIIFSTSLEKIKMKFIHFAHGRNYHNQKIAIQIEFDNYPEDGIMIELDRFVKNSPRWRKNFKTKMVPVFPTSTKISKEEFIGLVEALKIKDNMEV